ncbi:MAG: TetR family transcriptional regulator C-terminal domain-containing protein [Rhodospirillales bacterium]|nr:TetR family transcriptional regulator C-terminal domain-containing protein [Rhodospirillales bacterium]
MATAKASKRKTVAAAPSSVRPKCAARPVRGKRLARNRRGDTGPAGSIRARNQARILKAAEAVFAAKGLSGATTAEIAQRAGVPKPNLHYYFGTKQQLYESVIRNILGLWLGAMDEIRPDADPAQAIGNYIRSKIRYSRDWPEASRIFAIEIIGGGKHVMGFLKTNLRKLVKEKGEAIRAWAAAGKMDPVDPAHVMFMIWAATQTYADFAAQIGAVLDKNPRADDVFETATETVVNIVLKGCGIAR